MPLSCCPQGSTFRGIHACRLLYCISPFFTQLLDYVMTTLLFSDRNVDSNLVTWNRVVLLHGKGGGPPLTPPVCGVCPSVGS